MQPQARAMVRPPAWHAPNLPVMPLELADDGLCTRHPEPDLWSSRRPSDRARAQQVCSACPVRVICQDWSLSLPVSDSSVWGGLNHAQRLILKRHRAAQAFP